MHRCTSIDDTLYSLTITVYPWLQTTQLKKIRNPPILHVRDFKAESVAAAENPAEMASSSYPDSTPNLPEEEAYEEKNVHEVYQQIAEHFSSTRYKPWPIVEDFLKGLTPGSIGLDVGCGNGKYLSVNKEVFIVASDR